MSGPAFTADAVVPLPLPPPGFDPATADQVALYGYGFPTRPPKQDAAPAAHDLWHRAFTPRTTYLRPVLTPLLDSQTYFLDENPGTVDDNWLTSRNWSGQVLGASKGRLFSGVAGEWTVPENLSIPASPCDATTSEPLDGLWRCSAWVGLDGTRAAASSLPQIGTDHTIDQAGAVTDRAWVQWFSLPGTGRGTGFGVPPQHIVGFPLRRDDSVAGFVTLGTPTEATFALVNLTCDPPVAMLLRLAPPCFCAPLDDIVVGETAEWVVERPTKIPLPEMESVNGPPTYPLPEFSPIVFSRCSVQSTERITRMGPRRFGNLGAAPSPIAMFQICRPQNRTVTIARPRLREDGVEVRYTG